MNWSILGIEPTKDKAVIERAFRETAASGTVDLQEAERAFREALAWADAASASQADAVALAGWTGRLAALYSDFRARIDVNEWQALLSDDFCTSPATRPQVESALLEYLMDHYYLPREIWSYLDGQFGFSSRQAELYERYPRDFINYIVLGGIRRDELLPYKLFSPGKNGSEIERYIQLYSDARRIPAAEADAEIAKLFELSERHPYGDALACIADMDKGNTGRLSDLVAICVLYPNDANLQLQLADQYIKAASWDRAEQVCRRVLAQDSGNMTAGWLLSRSLAGQGRYREAVDLTEELIMASGGDERQISALTEQRSEWNLSLISHYQEALEADPADQTARYELARCLDQNGLADQALEIAGQLEEGSPDTFSYHNLMSSIYYDLQDYETAIDHTDRLIESIDTLIPADGTDTAYLGYLPAILSRRASCLMKLGRSDEADRLYEETVRQIPGDAQLLTQLIRTKMHLHDYDRAAELAGQLTQLIPDSPDAHTLLASVLCEQHLDEAAMEALSRAAELHEPTAEEYLLQLRILVRNDAYAQAHQIIDMLREGDAADDIRLGWAEARLANDEDGKPDEALYMYRALDGRIAESAEKYFWVPEFYYDMASAAAAVQHAGGDISNRELISLLDKGLETDPADPACMEFKAWLLKQEGDADEAIELYHRLEQLPHSDLTIEKQLAELYYTDLHSGACMSLQYYNMLLTETPDEPSYLYYAGMCHLYMGHLEEAEAHFLREIELEPGTIDGYHRLATVYEARGRLTDALAYAEKAIDIVFGAEGDYSAYYLHKVRILRRLGRAAEAADTARLTMSKFGTDTRSLISEIYFQAGMWSDAEKHIERWGREKEDRGPAARDEVILDVLQEKTRRADLTYMNKSSQMDGRDARDAQDALNRVRGRYKAALKVYERRIETAVKRGRSEYTEQLTAAAKAQWMIGDTDAARRYAEDAIAQIDEQLDGYLRDESLWRTRKAAMLTILGRRDEARAELLAVRALPLCEYCPYGSCKDAELGETFLEAALGSKDAAAQMAADGRRRWPDEIGFMELENYLKKK